MEKLTQDQRFDVADRIYRFVNPDSKMDTPNAAYITTESWYKEYLEHEENNIPFYDWCIKFKDVPAKKLQPVAALEDGDGHWYVIPSGEVDLFNNMLERGEVDEYYEFNEKFSKYMTGGALNNTQLYAEI